MMPKNRLTAPTDVRSTSHENSPSGDTVAACERRRGPIIRSAVEANLMRVSRDILSFKTSLVASASIRLSLSDSSCVSNFSSFAICSCILATASCLNTVSPETHPSEFVNPSNVSSTSRRGTSEAVTSCFFEILAGLCDPSDPLSDTVGIMISGFWSVT